MAVLAADDEEFTVETRVASPADLLIKIESFSLLSKNGIQKYESNEFESGGYNWKLTIHLDGLMKSENDDNHISVCLTIVKRLGSCSKPDVGWEVNAAFNIFLYNQILDNYLCFRGKARRFHALKSQWGIPKLISKKTLKDPSNGFLVDDTCVFGAEVFVIKTQRVIEHVSVLDTAYPYKRDWKISDFSKLREEWASEEFTAGNHEWRIWLYPKGIGTDEGLNVSVFLESVNSKSFAPHEKVKADFRLHIKDQFHDEQLYRQTLSHWFTFSSPDWGYVEFLPISDMRDPNNGYIVNDCCILEVQVSVQAVSLATCEKVKAEFRSGIKPSRH